MKAKPWRAAVGGVALCAAAFFAVSSTAVATPSFMGTPGPLAIPAPGAGIPGPTAVPGKEYSNGNCELGPCQIPLNLGDKNDMGIPDNEQNLRWDGTGGVVDTFDYDGSDGIFLTGEQVDALANGGDLADHQDRNQRQSRRHAEASRQSACAEERDDDS